MEVCPSSTKELPPGTRLCAYWSQQYRCLYPGTSVEPTEPDPELDEKFVSVEFDDGDSGRIALDDIRLLQPDYPVVGKLFCLASIRLPFERALQWCFPHLSSENVLPIPNPMCSRLFIDLYIHRVSLGGCRNIYKRI